jgi:hypothetical protein
VTEGTGGLIRWRGLTALVAVTVLLCSCGQAEDVPTGDAGPMTDSGRQAVPPESGCVAILRLPVQEVELSEMLNQITPVRLLSAPLGTQYDLAFYNGSSPFIQIQRPPLSEEVVRADLDSLEDWVSSNPQYGASLELRPAEADCDPLADISTGATGG